LVLMQSNNMPNKFGVQCPSLAHLRHAGSLLACLLTGENRK
jgi:hypothetical protein